MKKLAATIRERLPNVDSYSVHGITNAAIYCYCGGFDLLPQ
jgi:hypothetical protein